MQFQSMLSKANSLGGKRIVGTFTQQSFHSGNPVKVAASQAWTATTSRNVNRQPWKANFQTQFSTVTLGDENAEKVSDVEKKKGEIAMLIRKIKADLVETDFNKDGRIDAEELKAVLKKYPAVFSDSDVFEIGELFYTSRGGESVSHERFMAAISNTIEGKTEVDEEDVMHRRKGTMSHPLGLGSCSTEYMYGKSRGVYSEEELDVKLTHMEPKTMSDKIALKAVGVVRFLFDAVSLWNTGEITQAKVLRRVIFLETVAGIPGFVAAMNRHFKSLRNFTRDGGMLNMFLDGTSTVRRGRIEELHLVFWR
jgi:hypothetical protein